ncbi:MAG: response regulator transcription factor [Wenzhouxiangella sp.]|nr:response regulator transcription factor [Wenzhouxiangella sp.]
MSTRIALADDQVLVLKGLKSLLEDMTGIQVLIEAQSGGELLAALGDQDVDLVISDIRMPGMDGIELTRRLRELKPHIPVLLLTTFDDQALMLAAVEAGAQGFLLKDISPEDLEAAIGDIIAGRSLLQPVSTSAVRQRYAYHDDSAPTDTFSEREVAILRLLAGGYSNKEIARSIHLAEGTVKNYVSDILAKLETRDRTRAVLKAITLRVI